MRKIRKSEYMKKHPDYRGKWTVERWDIPDWKEKRHLYMGKRTMLCNSDRGTCLLIEGLHFEIVPN